MSEITAMANRARALKESVPAYGAAWYALSRAAMELDEAARYAAEEATS